MGRGLSDLQRYILREAGRRRRVSHAEILVGFFGWTELTGPFHIYKFSSRSIGKEAHRKTWVTLSRSLARLKARGLVSDAPWVDNRIGRGIEITDKGREWLSVNEVPLADFINR